MSDKVLQIKLINQALAAAAASIELSKQLLAELTGTQKPVAVSAVINFASRPTNVSVSTSTLSVPGTVGVFDGENMVAEGGTKYPVPANYASKTLLVYGDKLKMIDGNMPSEASVKSGETGGKIFKQIERVKRQRVVGTLSQKDGTWCLTTPEGSYKVLEASIRHFGAKVGDSLTGILPKDNQVAPFAALEGLVNQKAEQKAVTVEEPTPVKKVPEVKAVAVTLEVKPAKEELSQKIELAPKKLSPKFARTPKATAGVSVAKVTLFKAEKKEEAPVPSVKTEKTEKKNEPIISDDDLR